MIEGVVNEYRDAVITLHVRGTGNDAITVSAIIDTGFTDYLALPLEIVSKLRLPVEGATQVTLADQTVTYVSIYLAEVEWFGSWRVVPIIELSGTALVGMSLLHGNHLHVHVVEGGRIELH
jgi:clan AA aspartic protease